MPTLAIVVPDCLLGTNPELFKGSYIPVDEVLVLDDAVNTLRVGVVLGNHPHARKYTMLALQLKVGVAAILATPIGMMNKPLKATLLPNGSAQQALVYRRPQGIGHLIPLDLPAVNIQDKGEVAKAAVTQREVGGIGLPDLVGPGNRHSLDEVREPLGACNGGHLPTMLPFEPVAAGNEQVDAAISTNSFRTNRFVELAHPAPWVQAANPIHLPKEVR